MPGNLGAPLDRVSESKAQRCYIGGSVLYWTVHYLRQHVAKGRSKSTAGCTRRRIQRKLACIALIAPAFQKLRSSHKAASLHCEVPVFPLESSAMPSRPSAAALATKYARLKAKHRLLQHEREIDFHKSCIWKSRASASPNRLEAKYERMTHQSEVHYHTARIYRAKYRAEKKLRAAANEPPSDEDASEDVSDSESEPEESGSQDDEGIEPRSGAESVGRPTSVRPICCDPVAVLYLTPHTIYASGRRQWRRWREPNAPPGTRELGRSRSGTATPGCSAR